MKILVVTPYDLSIAGGVTSHVNQVVKQLRRMGHDALLLGPASRSLKPDRYTVTIGGTIRFFSPGDAASIPKPIETAHTMSAYKPVRLFMSSPSR